jgi:tripartite-type tricarboxylate transporter receptor subunit TctC
LPLLLGALSSSASSARPPMRPPLTPPPPWTTTRPGPSASSCPYPAGGIADKIAREVAEQLQQRLKQPVVVENRSGAAGNIGFEYVARQPADGYTLLLAPASNLTVQPALFKQLSYDLARDFTPVSLLVQTPQVLLVNPKLPVATPRELIDYSKKNPGKVNYGISVGAYSHLAGELLKTQTGADFTAIPYQGSAPAINDLFAGQTQFIFNEVITAIPFVKAGTLRPLAVAYKTARAVAARRAHNRRGRPARLRGHVLVRRGGAQRHAGAAGAAPVARAARHRAVGRLQKRYDDIGAFTVGNTPEEFGRFIQSETVKWTAVVKQAGIQPN